MTTGNGAGPTDDEEASTGDVDGATPEASNDTAGPWIPAAELARMLGISAKAVSELGKNGELRRKRENTHTPWLYLVPKSLRLEREDLVSQLRAALKEANADVRALVALVKDPARLMLELFAQTNKAQQEAIASLTSAQTGWIVAREEALNLAHVRDLDTALAMKKSARWDAAFETLARNAPALGAQLLETVAAWVIGSRGQEALELLRALEHLVDDERVPVDVRERLRDLLKKTAPPDPRGASSSDATDTEGSSADGAAT
jgi:hypothetical protein